jgi:lipopolysaccharide transport system ATP-binding protein
MKKTSPYEFTNRVLRQQNYNEGLLNKMSETVIQVENLSKQYRLGMVGTGTLSHDLSRWWAAVRGKEDPYLKIGEANDRLQKGNSEYVWALRDINFEVKQGEVLGIIGKNGAGKSTLLKILSRVTLPTTGEIKIKGRIASLLEVGTGFHPELSGRENIFLNGAILGMKKNEIKKKFDEIVDFSGVERYIDTPVKRYSSGMYVRLAFAVAAHLEPEILILDEVLAVGDAEFQKKCLGKMKDVAEQGRTVLFVSHNMAAVRNLCGRGILLENGKNIYSGEINEIVEQYLKPQGEMEKAKGMVIWENGNAPGGEEMKLSSIRMLNAKNEVSSSFYTSSPIKVEINYDVMQDISGSRIVMQLMDIHGNVVFASTNHLADSEKKTKGIYITHCTIPENLLNKGQYTILIHIGIPGVKVLVKGEPFITFDAILMGNHGSVYKENWPGVVAPLLKWETEKKS